jgi:hypothetical protein
MNPTGKKFISLFLVFSLMMLSINLYAKERRGAKLLITKKDGQQVEGELITVKPNSLLLLNTEGKDVSVDIAEIKVIKILKKPKAAGKGALKGLYVGGGLGVIAFVVNIGNEDHSALASFVDTIILIGLPAVIIGAIIGGATGKGKTIQIEGMPDSEIQETLDKLRKKARIRNYK